MKMGTGLKVLVLAAAVMTAAGAWAWEWGWSWGMPGGIYKQLDFQSRAGVDRANKIFGQAWESERRGAKSTDLVPQYRAAAAEWRKVQMQAETQDADENLLAYSVFMQAFALMKAHDRNEATKRYEEVIDLYEELTWVSFAAKYFIAESKMGMGDTKTGWKMFEELLDETDADKMHHALMGDVINRVAWSRWGEYKEDEAQELWQKGRDPAYCENNRTIWNSCGDGLYLSTLVRADFAVLEDMIFGGVKEDNHAKRADIVRDTANRIRNDLGNGNSGLMRYYQGKYKEDSKRGEFVKKFRKNLIGWFESKKHHFVNAKREFEFDVQNIRMHYGFESKEQIMKRIQTLVAQLASIKDDGARNGRIEALIGLYDEQGEYLEEIFLSDRLRPATYAVRKRYGLTSGFCHRGIKGFGWADCLKILDEYVALKPEADGIRWSKWERAYLHKNKLGQPEKAVPIFLDLAEPPKTLWELVYCYRAMKEPSKAEMLLDEIASMFKNEAPQAVWVLAGFCEQDGNKKKAIALYRRLLSQPEWKQTQQSSWAHQALERLGERTGGAMTNTVR